MSLLLELSLNNLVLLSDEIKTEISVLQQKAEDL